jgi:hypothetical protein
MSQKPGALHHEVDLVTAANDFARLDRPDRVS